VLSALLAPLIQHSAAPELSVVAATDSNEFGGPVVAAGAIVSEIAPSFAVHSIDTASSQPAAISQTDSQPTADAVRAAFERPARPAEKTPTAAISPREIACEETLAAVDHDLMIVEDDPFSAQAPLSVSRPPQAKRLEYRQLFSTLRRG